MNSSAWRTFRTEVCRAKATLKTARHTVEIREIEPAAYKASKKQVTVPSQDRKATKYRRTKEEQAEHAADADKAREFKEDAACATLTAYLKTVSTVQQYVVNPIIDRMHHNVKSYQPLAAHELPRAKGEEMTRTLFTTLNVPEITHFTKFVEVKETEVEEKSDEDEVQMNDEDDPIETPAPTASAQSSKAVTVLKPSAYSSIYQPVVVTDEVSCRIYHGRGEWYKPSVDRSDTQKVKLLCVDFPRGTVPSTEDNDYDTPLHNPKDTVRMLCRQS